tara:strand:- start:503 stop:739 length:237 start_codon:yes stop_codon:yes gene_type:complete
MTMPHLMNCAHSDSGWCLDCVRALHDLYEAEQYYCGLLANNLEIDTYEYDDEDQPPEIVEARKALEEVYETYTNQIKS